MKAITVRTAAGAALLLALGACGGKASFDVGGVFLDGNNLPKALTNTGLQLQNGGETLDVPTGVTSFKFKNSISYGTAYDIKIVRQPAHMECSISNGSGSAGHTATISANVYCNQNSYTIGGLVTGITGDAIVTLTNGTNGGTVLLTKDSGSFTFAGKVFVGQSYGVTVAKIESPTNSVFINCSVANSTSVMGDAPRTDIVVTCVPK